MNDTIYFDNAATTFPKPEIVYTTMDSFYRNIGVNVGRGQYDLSSKASSVINDTRELLLELFKAYNKQVLFTPSATEGINIVLNSLIDNKNLNVYITPFEHNAITRTLHHLHKKFDFTEYYLSVNSEYEYDLDLIRQQFRKAPPHIVITTHASNVFGLITPVDLIFKLAKQYGATTIVDAAQTAGVLDIAVNDMNIDYLIFPGHKSLYGPLGVGGIICDDENKLMPLIFGGTGIDSANPEMPYDYPQRIEVGSQNVLAIAGLNAALKWINEISIVSIQAAEKEARNKLIGLLSRFSNIQVVGPTLDINSVGVVSCKFDGYSSNEIGKIFSNQGIAVRTGLHCSPSAHKFLGTFPEGTVRFSLSYFNSDKDFVELNRVLNHIEENC